VRAATNVGDFVRSPVGRYLVARRHLVWCHSPTLLGTALWGRPDEADVLELLDTLAVTRAPQVRAPFDFLTDGRHVDGVDPAGYQLAVDYARRELERLGERVRRLAFVHGAGFSGTVLAGFFAHVLPRASSRGFSDPAGAFTWLGRRAGARAAAEVERLVDEAAGAPPITATLRTWLRPRAGECRLEDAARELGCSPRSLQRRLDAEGTTFQKQLDDARVSAAIPLILDSEVKLAAIAAKLGFSSLPAFSRLFRRVTGRSPSAFRAGRGH
jgi:AraC-like DNA-binding protein